MNIPRYSKKPKTKGGHFLLPFHKIKLNIMLLMDKT